MSDRTSSQTHSIRLSDYPESVRYEYFEEDDTQIVEIDCIYTTWLLSELESEFEVDDPEVVELIGHNTPSPRG